MKNIEEVKKEIRESAFKEYAKGKEEYKKESKKKIIIILSIVVIIVLIKVTIGTIELKSPLSYNKNRLYDVYVNDDLIMVDAEDHYRIPLIPYLLYYNSYNSTVYNALDGFGYPYLINTDEKLILTINSYSCYPQSFKNQMSCHSEQEGLKKVKNTDTKYINLFIRKNGNPDKIMYDGKFISDITSYITEKGSYYIAITAKYSNVESKVSFVVRNKK